MDALVGTTTCEVTSNMQYKVFVRTGAIGYDEYKVYSHRLDNGCLVMSMGRLKYSQGPSEVVIPVAQFISYHTEDIDE